MDFHLKKKTYFNEFSFFFLTNSLLLFCRGQENEENYDDVGFGSEGKKTYYHGQRTNKKHVWNAITNQ